MSALRAGLVEVFWLRRAERIVLSYDDERLAKVQSEKALARARLRASSRIAYAPAAAELVGDAIAHSLAAAHVARGAAEPLDALAELDALSLPDAQREAARALLAPTETDGLPFAQVETLRDRGEEAAHAVLRAVESRSKTAIVALRWGRLAAVLVAIAAIAWPPIRDHYLVHNVALHKPVMSSAVHPPPSNADGVTDGRTRGTFGVQTAEGKHTFVMVDLERTYALRRVRVFNRGDGWFDEILPVALEVSTDGVTFREVARRTDHFDVWTVPLDGVDARYVRLFKDSGYIAINELEVYARP